MTAPSLDSFFAGGGGKSISWKDKPIGTTVSGTIKAVNPPQQQTDPKDGSLQFKKNGEPKMSVRIDLATNFRAYEMTKAPDDPNEPDDGDRGLYVQSWLQGAIGDALRKAGRTGPPEVGGQLTVTLIERTPNDIPALSPVNKFSAVYVSPSTAATGQFFGNTQAIPQPGYAPGSGYQQAAPPALPPRPSAIAEAAWNAMDDATKRSVATTMADVPPF